MKKKYTGAELRHIAMGTMFIDHIAVCLLENSAFMEVAAGEWLYLIFRFIGRMAFPLYCFLMTESFQHTKHRAKYLLTLIVMGIITEPIFDYAIYGTWNQTHQNVLFTLSIGFILIWLLEKIKKTADSINSYPAKIGILLFGSIAAIASSGFLSLKFHFDYGVTGILYLAILYLMKENRDGKAVGGILILGSESGLGALGSIYLIHQYNGEFGHLKVPRLFYRIFYPLHLFVLLAIRKWILKI